MSVLQHRLAVIVCGVLVLSFVVVMALTTSAQRQDRRLLTAASEMAVGVALRQAGTPGAAETMHPLARANAAAASIEENARALVVFNRARVADLALQVDTHWQAVKSAPGVPDPAVGSQPGVVIASLSGLDELVDQFSGLFSAITTQSLSADVIGDVSEVGSDLNLLISLDRLFGNRELIGLQDELSAAHQKLLASTARLVARTGNDGALRGYRLRQLIAQFSASIKSIDLPRPAGAALVDPLPPTNLSPGHNALPRALEQYMAALRAALAGYQRILSTLLILACAGALALSVLGLRRLRLHGRKLSAIAASGIEAQELKQSWVEQARAIATGDCTFRWRATDDSNRDIAQALNSTTDTICSLVRLQKASVIELEGHCSALQSSQALLRENLLARQASTAEMLACMAKVDTIGVRAAQWVGGISDVTTNIREQTDQLSGGIFNGIPTESTSGLEQTLARLAAAEQILEGAVDRIVGVRQITDQSKLLTLNVSLQMVTDGGDEDSSAELAEQVRQQAERVESEVTQIERSVRGVSDELHGSLAQLRHDIDHRQADTPPSLDLLPGLMDSLAQGITGLSDIAADIYEVSSQRVDVAETIKKNTQTLRALDESDQSLIDDSHLRVDRIVELGGGLRDAVAHYVIPVSGR